MKKNLFLALALLLGVVQADAYTFYFQPGSWAGTYAKYAVQSWSTDYDAAVYGDEFMTPVAGHDGWFTTSVPDVNSNLYVCAYNSDATDPAEGAVNWTQVENGGTYIYFHNNVGWMEDFDGKLLDGRILSGNIIYTVDDEHQTAEVAYDQSPVAPSGELTIPSSFTWKTTTYTVTSIYAQAYMYSGIESVSLPNTLLHIGDAAFLQSGLTSVNIPSSVTSIDDAAFALCGNLSSVTLEEGLTALATQMFQYDHNLTEIKVPNSIRDLPTGVFSYCNGLTSITLGTGVDTIGANAFGGSDNLVRLTIYAPAPPKVDSYDHPALVTTCTIMVPSSVMEAYEAHDYWGQFDIKGIYIVTFKDKEGNTLKTQAVEEGQSATAPDAPLVDCYTFTGWDETFNNVTSDLTVNAQYSINTYTVTFKDWDDTTLKSHTVDCGSDASAPADPSREGYTFTGWSPADFTGITANLTVTAQYEINKYTVIFKDWDGTTLETQENVEWNTAATAPDDPERACYTFAGWDKAFDHVQSDLTVNAQYSLNTYTVKFKDNDGTVLKDTTVNCGTAAVAPADPSREGYTFTGWSPADFTGITANLTVTAQYEINKYTVIFKDWDGTTLETQENVEWNTAATAPDDPERACYTFAGWDKAFDHVQSDLTVNAQYSLNTYTVKFKDNDGTVLKDTTVNCGTAAVAPAAPHHTGYTFTGWDTDFSDVQANLIVTAEFVRGEDANITVEFYDTEDEIIAFSNVVIRIPAADDIEGFTFIGWRPVPENILDNATIKIEAVYIANEPTNAPAVYTNPANPAQKLVRDGNVYILRDDHEYTITGLKVK